MVKFCVLFGVNYHVSTKDIVHVKAESRKSRQMDIKCSQRRITLTADFCRIETR